MIDPARYYTASIFLTQKGIDSAHFTGVKNMLQPNGKLYPNNKEDPYYTPDPEANCILIVAPFAISMFGGETYHGSRECPCFKLF